MGLIKNSIWGAVATAAATMSVACSGVDLSSPPKSSYPGSVVTCRCSCIDTCKSPGDYVFGTDGVFIGCLGGPGTTSYSNDSEAKSCVDPGELGDPAFETSACEKACDQLDIRYAGATSTAINPLRTCHVSTPDAISPVVSKSANTCSLEVGTTHNPLSTGDSGNPEKATADVDSANSSATLTSNGQGSTAKVSGRIAIEGGNCPNAVCSITLSLVHLEAAPFTLGGKGISNATLENTGMIVGTKAVDGTLSFPSGTTTLSISGMIGSDPVGLQFPASTSGLGGKYDPATGSISLTATGSSSDGKQSVSVSVQGSASQLPPQVEAGPDQTVACTGDIVHLDGSSSRDPNSLPLNFSWVDGTTLLGTTAKLDVVLSTPGIHDIRLTANDERGLASSDVVRVTVQKSSAPKFTYVPPALTVTDCAATPNIGKATATNACGSAVTISNDAPARFLPGRTLVTWKATDATGNSVTATQVVTVLLGDNPVCCPPNANVIVGTPNNDTLVGTAGADCILGLGGQDTISGLGGDDYISGGTGDDLLSGGAGNDRLFGGAGQDTANAGDGDDLVCGGDGNDRLNGDLGNDLLIGGDGQDQLAGGEGNDTIEGGLGDDRLDGGNGNDKLDGGGIHDICMGGAGTNTFVNCETKQ